jgi:uncharacterized protein involved in cysteine biosynthesis
MFKSILLTIFMVAASVAATISSPFLGGVAFAITTMFVGINLAHYTSRRNLEK